MAPLGFFDPLGFCKIGDEFGFRMLREAELMHPPVAMLASDWFGRQLGHSQPSPTLAVPTRKESMRP